METQSENTVNTCQTPNNRGKYDNMNFNQLETQLANLESILRTIDLVNKTIIHNTLKIKTFLASYTTLSDILSPDIFCLSESVPLTVDFEEQVKKLFNKYLLPSLCNQPLPKTIKICLDNLCDCYVLQTFERIKCNPNVKYNGEPDSIYLRKVILHNKKVISKFKSLLTTYSDGTYENIDNPRTDIEKDIIYILDLLIESA